MAGKLRIDFLKLKEQYHFKQPSVSAGGILFGTQTIELYDTLKIWNFSTNLKVSLTFTIGSENCFTGYLYNMKTKKKLYTLEGNLHSKVYYTEIESKKKTLLYDAKKIKLGKKIVEPVYKQNEIESRRNWHKVTVNLLNQNYDKATEEKSIVEERERSLRKKREEKSEKWIPSLFVYSEKEKNWVYKKSEQPKSNFIEKTEDSEEVESWGSYIKSFW